MDCHANQRLAPTPGRRTQENVSLLDEASPEASPHQAVAHCSLGILLREAERHITLIDSFLQSLKTCCGSVP